MKRIIILFFAFAIVSFSFAQSSVNEKMKRNAKEASITLGNTDVVVQPRAVDCVWSSDFEDANDWDISHDSNDCSLDWEIGNQLSTSGFFPISSIESEGSYAMIDSDAYGGEEGGTETEDSWLTTANSIDCSNLPNVVVEFETWYRSWTYEKCFLVVSTDGTFPDDLTPESDEDPSNGIYEIFPGISGDGGADLGDNPTIKRINISESAGSQSEVWIRFNWTGTWGYAWFIDDVCVMEQPADDITLSYGVVTHNGSGEEYGRVPIEQLGDGVTGGAGVYNFGINNQSDVSVSMDVTNSTGYPVLSETWGESEMYEWDGTAYVSASFPVVSDQDVYFEKEVDIDATVAADIYTSTFTVTSDGESDGDFFADNTAVRDYAFTNTLYSVDGIDVYSNSSVNRMGTGSFTDGSDGFMMMAYYDISSGTNVAGVTIMLDSYLYGSNTATVAGGELVVALRDTSLISSDTFDPGDVIETSDFYLVSQGDIDNGFITVAFDSPIYLSPDAYFVSVEMYSNGNEADVYILDDETVPQPFYLSMIYIPGDQVYSNGTAAGIRLITGDSVGLEEEIGGLHVYPNPSNGIVNIKLNENGDFLVQVNDILGKVVSEKIIHSNTTLNLQNLKKGVYFVNVSNDNITKTTKVIIE